MTMNSFRLEGDAQKRLDELSERKATGLEDERALCAYLLEMAARNGSVGLANNLLATSARLSLADEAAKIRSNEMLSRAALLGLVREIVSIVVDELEGIPSQERIVDRILDRVMASVSSAANSAPKRQEPLRDKS